MQKFIKVFLVIILILGSFFSVSKTFAQDSYSEEAVANFGAEIIVNTDNSIDVTETIQYNSGPYTRHGIYRDINTKSSQKRKMRIENVSVVDQNGVEQPFELIDSSYNVRVKIGDPDKTFNGERIYILKYHATRAIAQFDNFDEIYWNVTGNDWEIPIYKAQASVVFPEGATYLQSSCYYGEEGSTNTCALKNSGPVSFSFESPDKLYIGQGLTVAVGISKGVLMPYGADDEKITFWDTYFPWVVSSIIPILTFIICMLYWYKKGRDAKGTGVIIPQYDVIDGLSPMEVSGIVNQRVSSKEISAEIIYLATKGYIKIRELETSFIGLIKRKDYEFVKLKNPDPLENPFDKKLLNSLFNPNNLKADLLSLINGASEKYAFLTKVLNIKKLKEVDEDKNDPNELKTVKLSELENEFYTKIKVIITAVLDALLNKGYYSNLGRIKSGGSGLIITAFMCLWCVGFFGPILGLLLFEDNFIAPIAAIIASFVIYAVISRFFPAKTKKGIEAYEYLLGLKDYLKIAEKDRLLFHNAPEKKPEIFEKLLPYAMVLGVADIWAKEFEGIYQTPPSWYEGSPGSMFSAVAFSHSLSDFSSSAASSLSSSPSGSGSGGGGSSGGGGGGGGGGGW